jgi:hypothetical protein
MAEEQKPPACRWFEQRVNRFYGTPWGQHLKAARKEMLLAVRAMIDHGIERLDTLGQESAPRKIEVE